MCHVCQRVGWEWAEVCVTWTTTDVDEGGRGARTKEEGRPRRGEARRGGGLDDVACKTGLILGTILHFALLWRGATGPTVSDTVCVGAGIEASAPFSFPSPPNPFSGRSTPPPSDDKQHFFFFMFFALCVVAAPALSIFGGAPFRTSIAMILGDACFYGLPRRDAGAEGGGGRGTGAETGTAGGGGVAQAPAPPPTTTTTTTATWRFWSSLTRAPAKTWQVGLRHR